MKLLLENWREYLANDEAIIASRMGTDDPYGQLYWASINMSWFELDKSPSVGELEHGQPAEPDIAAAGQDIVLEMQYPLFYYLIATRSKELGRKFPNLPHIYLRSIITKIGVMSGDELGKRLVEWRVKRVLENMRFELDRLQKRKKEIEDKIASKHWRNPKTGLKRLEEWQQEWEGAKDNFSLAEADLLSAALKKIPGVVSLVEKKVEERLK